MRSKIFLKFFLRRLKTLSFILRRWRIWGWIRHCLDYGYYDLHRTVRFNGKGIVLSGIGTIKIGKNSALGRHVLIQSNYGLEVTIGEDCAIAAFTHIYTENRDGTGNVHIGNNCWIGVGCWINEGVTIGDNVTIGTNSVVLSDIPSNSVAVGSPARVVNARRPAGNHVINENARLDQLSYGKMKKNDKANF